MEKYNATNIVDAVDEDFDRAQRERKAMSDKLLPDGEVAKRVKEIMSKRQTVNEIAEAAHKAEIEYLAFRFIMTGRTEPKKGSRKR